MRKSTKGNSAIESSRLGAIIRSERERLYGRNAARFIEDLNALTNAQISKDMLYRFENGDCMLSVVQLVSICMTLYKGYWSVELGNILAESFRLDFVKLDEGLRELSESELNGIAVARVARYLKESDERVNGVEEITRRHDAERLGISVDDLNASLFPSIPADSGGVE